MLLAILSWQQLISGIRKNKGIPNMIKRFSNMRDVSMEGNY